VLYLSSPTQTGPTFSWCWVSGCVGSPFHDVTRGLLQCHSRWGIQVHHRQTPVSTECCRSRRQWHTEVRPRTHPSPARWAALAGRSSAGVVQAVCNGPSMSAAQSTTVHDRLLHPYLRRSSAASAVRRLSSTVCTVTPAFDVWSLCLFCGRPGGLELVTKLPARSVSFFWQFLPGPKTFLFSFY